jgi:aspartokinase-like uncharacterized kinase
MASPTVLKIGGSLLTKPDWYRGLYDWLQNQPAGLYLTIVGGGEAVEAMRELDQIHALDQTELHWRCIELLESTFEIASELLRRVIPDLRLLRSHESISSAVSVADIEAHDRAELALVSIKSFYSRSAFEKSSSASIQNEDLTPEIGWQTTSDTFAMFLATLVRAKRCVLFKSCDIESFGTLDDAIAAGVVDSQILKYPAVKICCELVKL